MLLAAAVIIFGDFAAMHNAILGKFAAKKSILGKLAEMHQKNRAPLCAPFARANTNVYVYPYCMTHSL